ncbi:rCG43092, isoform CRA_a [Rattus norvegicus]|uniref:RCG43092, isoform CRA_a n=1 Tax=Rattus norvegicus TaxID=10116 RepID=A6IVY7_RAT|nr:rCG43092, isoform CRA_a [Rattus norvegicus]
MPPPACSYPDCSDLRCTDSRVLSTQIEEKRMNMIIIYWIHV